MMKVTGIKKLVSLCGIVLGVSLVYSIAPPLIAEESNLAAGWYIVYTGDWCVYDVTLPCNGGHSAGFQGCSGGDFDGVHFGVRKHVWVAPWTAGCGTSANAGSYDCFNLNESYCL